jgi:hypothetical protein
MLSILSGSRVLWIVAQTHGCMVIWMRSELGTTDLNMNCRHSWCCCSANTCTTMHLNLRFSLPFNLHASRTQVQVINLLKRARKGGIAEDPLLALLLEESPNEVDCLPCMSDLHPRISPRELDCSSPYTSEVSVPFCYRHLILLQASHSASDI